VTTHVADESEASPPQVALLLQCLRFSSLLNRPMLDGVALPQGLTLNELRVLMSLGGEGQAAGHRLASIMAMPPMNVSRALAALHARGWISEGSDASNRRRKPYHLNAVGWAAYRAMTPEVSLVADFVFATLSAAEREAFGRIMAKLNAQVGSWPGGAGKSRTA
jgi:DNA-binding MarR family transcriptional regulator